tara:strand:- start:16570 stop:16782 length:213 start_codon:yes stop_codon:yes gene_type:complete
MMSKGFMALVAMMMLAMSAGDVLAQEEALRPPTTQDAPSSPKFIVWGVAILLTGLLVFAVTLKSKRGHQD